MAAMGVPYSQDEIDNAVADAKAQALEITEEMASSGVEAKVQDKQIIALIAYLQRLGKDLGGN